MAFGLPKLALPPTEEDATDSGTKKPGGTGYEWLMNKFIQLAADIAAIREQTIQDEDEGEYRKRVVRLALGAGETTGVFKLDPIPPGVEWRIERIIGCSTAGTPSLDIFNNGSNTFATLLSSILINVVSSLGNVREQQYSPPIVMRGGEELSFAVINGKENSSIEAIVWMRVIAEKPQGLAVGA